MTPADEQPAARINLVTLGVADLARATAFYAAIGFTRRLRAAEGVAFFQLGPLGLSLFPNTDLAEDAGVVPGGGGFRGASLARIVPTRGAVDGVIATMLAAGGHLMRAAVDKEWGGYSGYVADPDGHAWEIAWNPAFALDADGAITIPA